MSDLTLRLRSYGDFKRTTENNYSAAELLEGAADRIEQLERVVERQALGLMKIRTMQGDPIVIAREAMEPDAAVQQSPSPTKGE